jgi:O-antigen ligase
MISLKIRISQERWDSLKKMLPALVLWAMLWGGYNTEIERMFNPKFPESYLDLFHGLRSLLPCLAGYIALMILLKRQSFPKWIIQGPMGLLISYTLIGSISSLFFSNEPGIAIYWAAQYGSVLLVLAAIMTNSDSEDRLSRLISFNWVFVTVIMVSLLLGLMVLKDVALVSAEYSPLSVRAYASQYAHRGQILGMSATRNTGFARYASIAALVALTHLWHGRSGLRMIWGLIFSLSLYSLIIAQGRTEILSFITAGFILLWLRKTSTPLFIVSTLIAFIFLGLAGFYQGFWNYLFRGDSFDPTLTGRTETWNEGLTVIRESLLIGLGFHADRIFMDGQHMHNALLHALIQSGLIGTLLLVATFVKVYKLIARFHLAKRPLPFHPLRAEIPAVILFFTIASVTESTVAFFGAAWLIVAPLIAYLQAWNQTQKSEFSCANYVGFSDGEKFNQNLLSSG